jgi:carbon monoxide dehydrogenase subunit G
MRRAERSAEVSAATDEVYAFVSEIGNLPRWQSGVLRAEQTSPGPIQVGSTAAVERRVMGQRVQADLRVAELEPPRRIVLETDASGLHVEASVSLEPVDDHRCRVTFGMALEATSFFMQAVEPMVAQAAESDIADSLARLQEVFAPA